MSTLDQLGLMGVGIICLQTVVYCISAVSLEKRRKRLLRERRRLEKVLHDYNKLCKDDYNPFEDWGF